MTIGIASRKPFSVGVLFAGPALDGGFMEAGHRALIASAAKTHACVSIVDGVEPRPDALRLALRQLAETGHDLIIAHGGQNNEAALEVAAAFPNGTFAVTQGQVCADNVASYDVMQEHSAFLAGILAARTTRTGTVGHLSGIRVRPGLKGRAAFAHGVRHADPSVRFLTTFCGHQDDAGAAEAASRRLIAAGVDRLFTMLNSGRSGATAACRALDCLQIGNVDDWTVREPDVFVGSAMADVGFGISCAIEDFAEDRFPAGEIRHIGLERADAVGLAMHPSVPRGVRIEIAAAADAIRQKHLTVDVTWNAPEEQHAASPARQGSNAFGIRRQE
jgi:basic membrane protein A and related proteins